MKIIEKIDNYLVEKKMKIVKTGSKNQPNYQLMTPNGDELMDIFFDSPEKAMEYAKKKKYQIIK